MIVLDEQLLGRNLERDIAGWYAGKILFITDLLPDSIIKDDAIPGLLRQQNQPTFVTINEKDFWRRVDIDRQFCVICLVVSDSNLGEITQLLRSLFNIPEFKTKSKRMEKVVRIADNKISYYCYQNKEIKRI